MDEPVPDRLDGFWNRLEELHPGWKFVTWASSDREALSWMRCWDVFDAQETWAGKSDVLRYEVLAAFGGIYVDADVEPLKSFEPLLDGGPFAGWEDERLLCPTVMGSPAGHPAIESLITLLPSWAGARSGAPPNQATGPYFLTRFWRWRTDVRLLPPVAFYPVHWSEKRKLGGPYPAESYAVHHWDAGWLPAGPPQR